MSLKVLVYAQHLYGVGHVFRAKRVAEALAARGHATTLVLGGFEIPNLKVDGVRVQQLAPIRTFDGTYQKLVTVDDRPVDEQLEVQRCQDLLALADAIEPDVLILEGFPLARRKFRFELVPLLKAMHARASRPLIAVSVRDVLQRPAREKRIKEAIETFQTYCDALLVHGDASAGDVAESFPELAALTDSTHYTGIVGPQARALSAEDRPRDPTDVVVSAGGGAVGYGLLRAAILAKPRSDANDLRWLVLTGPNLADDKFDELSALASDTGITVERFHPNLRGVMAEAQLSIQQAGYNTVADLLTTKCRAVLVPFAEHGQTEQPARAEALQRRGRGVVVDEAGLTPETLVKGINAALCLPVPDTTVAMDGATRSAEIIEDLFAAHQDRR